MDVLQGDWYRIYNGDCVEAMRSMDAASVDMVLTSPPYNTCREHTIAECKDRPKEFYACRYDVHVESKTAEEYAVWTVELFNEFDRLLRKDGVVLYNYGMGNDSQSDSSADNWFRTMNAVIDGTPFTCADLLFWKKRCALPDNISPNHSTRIAEPVMVLCRKSEARTFRANKKVSSVRSTGQKMYVPFLNVIDAANNDGSNPLNKATYSTELCDRLMEMYLPDDHGPDYTVLDPFNGTGTTGVSCQKRGVRYVGAELSEAQCQYTVDRLEKGLAYVVEKSKGNGVTDVLF